MTPNMFAASMHSTSRMHHGNRVDFFRSVALCFKLGKIVGGRRLQGNFCIDAGVTAMHLFRAVMIVAKRQLPIRKDRRGDTKLCAMMCPFSPFR